MPLGADVTFGDRHAGGVHERGRKLGLRLCHLHHEQVLRGLCSREDSLLQKTGLGDSPQSSQRCGNRSLVLCSACRRRLLGTHCVPDAVLGAGSSEGNLGRWEYRKCTPLHGHSADTPLPFRYVAVGLDKAGASELVSIPPTPSLLTARWSQGKLPQQKEQFD